MERRHVQEGEERVVRQLALVAKWDSKGNDELAKLAVELLDLMRDILEFSRMRLQQLEDQFGKEPASKTPSETHYFCENDLWNGGFAKKADSFERDAVQFGGSAIRMRIRSFQSANGTYGRRGENAS